MINTNKHNIVKSTIRVLVIQLCLTLWDPMDCRPPGSSVHGILQAWILEWVAISFSRGSSWVSCIAGRFLTTWATRETPSQLYLKNKQTSSRRELKADRLASSSQLFGGLLPDACVGSSDHSHFSRKLDGWCTNPAGQHLPADRGVISSSFSLP